MGAIPDWLTANYGFIVLVASCALWIAVIAQFELSRRSTQRQLRAYVVPDGTEIFAGDGGEPRARITFRNCGQAPARAVSSWARIDLIESGSSDGFDPPEVAVRSSTTLAANGSLSKALWFRSLSQEEADHVRSGGKALCVSGRVKYSDVFRREHETLFRLAYTGPYPPPANASLDPAGGGNMET
jgi:hypothetical protein